MKKATLFLLTFMALLSSIYAIDSSSDSSTKTVVVSISPYKYFVDAIAGDTIKVFLLVPPGTSFHDYEPTPKQMANTVYADIWFRVGENFETRALNSLKNHNPRMKVIDLRDGVDLITLRSEGACPHCLQCGADLHIWLSPNQVKIQAKLIAAALSNVYPQYATLYQANLEKLLADLDKLDSEIREILAPLKNRKIMVSHSAYAYFAREFNLEQFPIEYEGRDPSPKQLNQILIHARAQNVKTIFVQKEHSSKGARLIADQLGAQVIELAPYTNDDYFGSMRNIAHKIAIDN